MRDSGFSLVELVVIMAIIGILLAIGTLNFQSMSRKSAVEGQVKTMYADLMTARSEALFRKRPKSVKISGSQFLSYSSTITDVAPQKTVTLKYPVTAETVVVFDTLGLTNFETPGAVCIASPEASVTMDAVVATRSMIFMGKLKTGMACNGENVVVK